MSAFFTALALFLLSFAVHVLVWRVRLPKNHTRALILIFALVPLGAALALVLAQPSLGRPVLALADLPGIALFYAGATGCYLIVYTGVEEDSPSVLIVRALESAAERGCSRAELSALVAPERFVQARFSALERDRFVAAAGTGNRLTAPGLRVARLSTWLARIFNLDEGA